MARTVSIVIPARNAAQHLGPCLDTVLPQVLELGGELVVVDDASTDGTGALAAKAGARVIRRTVAMGPYAARNDGWRAASASTIVFTDARCRARPGWLTALLRTLETPGVGVVGGETYVIGGDGAAQRYLASTNPYRTTSYLGHPFLPYVPTANLATTRKVLEGVGGFPSVRSGGDAEFCWRAQLAALGTVAAAREAVMDIETRATVWAVMGQWHRYGAANYRLYRDYEPAGHPAPTRADVLATVTGPLRGVLGRCVRLDFASLAVECTGVLVGVSYVAGFLQARRKH